jgi:hypothetical protein
MLLNPGTRLGPYEILAPLGTGCYPSRARKQAVNPSRDREGAVVSMHPGGNCKGASTRC